MALNYINAAVITLAHLAGLVVAIILLLKIKGTPAILATVAFGLLFIQSVGAILRAAFLDKLIINQMASRQAPWATGGFNCCCGILQLAAVICLVVAIWQAVSGSGAAAKETEELLETD